MVKILFYGGCHARVLRNLFRCIFSPEAAETELVINYELIAAGRPFPDELLEWSDVLVFSPIENKGDYNTDFMQDRCRAAGRQTICFPWMEWHAYCPGAEKGFFKGRYQWFYPGLLEIAERADSLDSFVDHVISNFPSDEIIDRTLARTSQIIVSTEKRHDTQVRIADFIDAHHRSSRLFLISDHPSLSLYMHVVEQIVDMIGLERPPDISARLPLREPQWQWRTPIFPRVAERLNLTFTDTQWIDEELLPHRTWPLETYLKLYFHKDGVILGPMGATGSLLPGCGHGLETSVDSSARIFASPLPNGESGDIGSFAYLGTLAGETVALETDTRFKIDSKRWRSTWQF